MKKEELSHEKFDSDFWDFLEGDEFGFDNIKIILMFSLLLFLGSHMLYLDCAC